MGKTRTNARMNGYGRSLGSAALLTVNAWLMSGRRTSSPTRSTNHRIDAVSVARIETEAMARRWLT
jgi:hypothetical protein